MERANGIKKATLLRSAKGDKAPRKLSKRPQTEKFRQERARIAHAKIARAAIAVLAKHGLFRLTHRSVASEAGVALAATTYYYATKSDIIRAASATILEHYVKTFERAIAEYRQNPDRSPTFQEFVWRQLRKVARQDRMMMMAWQEISLDAERGRDSLALMREWYREIDRLWIEIARAARTPDPENAARSGIDLVLGLLLMVCALSLTPDEIDAVLVRGGEPSLFWARFSGRTKSQVAHGRISPKADATRERILDAAIEIMIAEGPGAIGYRVIAERAHLTTAAPAYHFPTIASLLEAAQRKLFEGSKARYRDMMHALRPATTSIGELTAAIFLKEAAEFARVNLANFAIWVEAGRRRQLAPMVWSAVSDQEVAWRRLLTAVRGKSVQPRDGILAQALFLGKLQRVLSAGGNKTALAQVRAEFTRDIPAIEEGRFWAQRG